MQFQSLGFVVFLGAVFALYWRLPHRHRWLVLLAANACFYLSWSVPYLPLLAFTALQSYAAARWMACSKTQAQKKRILIASVGLCLGILVFFKYFNFVSTSVASVLSRVAVPVSPILLKVVQPVGISFYSFTVIGYLVDVYRGTLPAERHFGRYAAFVSFFPQVVSGPIGRAPQMLPQIGQERVFDERQAAEGWKRMAWGFFKKLVIADSCAVYVDTIYSDVLSFQGLALPVATVLFAIQLYCDFSGYSDLARGMAALLGIDIPENFRSPYFASSIREFWSRWHISLSTWFRDYVYIPLGGNRRGTARRMGNLMATFLLSGLWHGASWNYVIRGGIHGAAQCVEYLLPWGKKGEKGVFGRLFGTLLTFLFCCAAWVFFRAGTPTEALHVFRAALVGIGNPMAYVYQGYLDLGANVLSVVLLALAVLLLVVFDAAALTADPIPKLRALPKGLRWSLYFAFVLLTLVLYASLVSQNVSFIYLQY